MQSLTKAAQQLRGSVDPKTLALREAHNDLAESVRFCFQRGRILIDLVGCIEQLRGTLHGTEEFDIQAALEVGDSLRDLHKKASDFHALGLNTSAFDADGSGVGLKSKGADLEIECVCLHHLATVLHLCGFKMQARDLHKQVVLKGLLLDTSATDYNKPTRLLRERRWFMKSQQFVLEAQQDDAAAERRQREKDLSGMESQLDAIKKAQIEGLKPLLRHVFKHHPPPNGAKLDPSVNAEEDIPKGKFLRMLKNYHTDKIPENAPKSQKLLFEEIVKYLNHFYESDYK